MAVEHYRHNHRVHKDDKGMSFIPGLLPAVPANMSGLPPYVHYSMLTKNVMLPAGCPTPMPCNFCSIMMLASMRMHYFAGGNDTLTPRLCTACPVAMIAWRTQGRRHTMAGTGMGS